MPYRIAFLLALLMSITTVAQPIKLHPANPHYLEYKGKPLALVTSAEHYGAVINGAFDIHRYLETLHADGMNYTRIFTGSYIENPESTFGIEQNTLAPVSPENFFAPWKRTNQTGARDGGNLFDLDQWNPAYFDRLKAFVGRAAELDIIVEVTLFSSIYQETNWIMSPLHPENNVNGIDRIAHIFVHTPENGKLFAYQKAYTEKLVTELNAFDNIFFEIQNEPWSDQGNTKLYANPNNIGGRDGWWTKIDVATEASLEWQHAIAETIAETESTLPKKHLIAQNYANFKYPVPDVDPLISIMNFHYAWPDAVHLNYGYDRVISFDESGFSGSSDETYRIQAWRFMLAGGGVFNNLDYSFVAGYEDGTFDADSPGRGSPELRKQLRFLSDLLNAQDLTNLVPDRDLVKFAPGLVPQAMNDNNGRYIVYFERVDKRDKEVVRIGVPPGTYLIKWMDPESGSLLAEEQIDFQTGRLQLDCPAFGVDAVLYMQRHL